MKKIQVVIATLAVFLLLTASTTVCTNSNVTVIGNQYSVPLTNYGNWSPGPPTGEYYTGFWVMKDGGFFRNNYNPPAQPLTLTQSASGNTLAFSTVSNRKGDDGDGKKVSGGFQFSPANAPADLSYFSFPTNQHLNTGSSITAINTDHNSNYGLKSNEFMLVITINNDSNRLASNPKQPEAIKYNLHLYHNTPGINYIFIPGNAQGSYPCGNNQYFAFADISTSTFAVNGLTEIKSWEVASDFPSHQKNVYCLFTVPAGDFIEDDFTALLTNGNNNLVTSSVSTFPVTFGNSLDPNSIEVNKDTSNICGSHPESLTYTVHFQNTGQAPEDSVNINLELDPSLDPASLEVMNAGVGSTFHVSNASAPVSKVSNYSFNSSVATAMPGNNHPHFQYSINSNTQSVQCVGNVTPNVTFRFAGVSLQGISSAQVAETQGYVVFKVNAVRPYSSVHNRAGIFFCGQSAMNPSTHTPYEIITNLAVTTCMNPHGNNGGGGTDSCAAQLDQCHQQLQQCESNCHNWMYWLGWIIAGIEFIIMILLFARRKK